MRDIEDLMSAAAEAAKNCYCPFSGFRVAAVVEDSGGGLHRGVNVENSSYGLSMCAERSAVFAAVSGGTRDFARILVYSPDGEPLPCGACRQVLEEFCREDLQVVVASPDSISSYTLSELLPHPFRGSGPQQGE